MITFFQLFERFLLLFGWLQKIVGRIFSRTKKYESIHHVFDSYFFYLYFSSSLFFKRNFVNGNVRYIFTTLSRKGVILSAGLSLFMTLSAFVQIRNILDAMPFHEILLSIFYISSWSAVPLIWMHSKKGFIWTNIAILYEEIDEILTQLRINTDYYIIVIGTVLSSLLLFSSIVILDLILLLLSNNILVSLCRIIAMDIFFMVVFFFGTTFCIHMSTVCLRLNRMIMYLKKESKNIDTFNNLINEDFFERNSSYTTRLAYLKLQLLADAYQKLCTIIQLAEEICSVPIFIIIHLYPSLCSVAICMYIASSEVHYDAICMIFICSWGMGFIIMIGTLVKHMLNEAMLRICDWAIISLDREGIKSWPSLYLQTAVQKVEPKAGGLILIDTSCFLTMFGIATSVSVLYIQTRDSFK